MGGTFDLHINKYKKIDKHIKHSKRLSKILILVMIKHDKVII